MAGVVVEFGPVLAPKRCHKVSQKLETWRSGAMELLLQHLGFIASLDFTSLQKKKLWKKHIVE